MSGATPAPDPRPEMPEASLVGIVNVLLRRRWLIMLPAILAVAVVALLTLRAPRTYTATASFAPQARRSPGELSGLAAQFGLGVASGDPMSSPQFYVDLVGSRDVLEATAATRYDFPTDTGRIAGTLFDLYRPAAPTQGRRQELLVERLRRDLKVDHDAQTSVVTVAVTTPFAQLSTDVAARLLELVNTFNLERRQSQARSEREFIERRVAEVGAQLRTAEERLQQFLQRNREFGLSPALTLERERLQREVGLRQSLYTELMQNLEQVRVDEIRDTPIITVIERPQLPASPDARGLVRKSAVAVVLGGALGVVLAVAAEYLARARREEAGDFEQFVALRREAVRDVTRPWRPVARLLRRRDVG